MEKNKGTKLIEQDEMEEYGPNWPVVLPILIVMAAIILYVFLY